MKNIIEELFYGNIDPQARAVKKGSCIQKQMTILANSEAIKSYDLYWCGYHYSTISKSSKFIQCKKRGYLTLL